MADEESSEDWKEKYMRLKTRQAADKERLSELEGQVSTLEGQLKQLKPKAEAHDGLQQQLQTLTKEHTAEKSGRMFDRSVLAKGIAADDLEYVQYQYNKLPEKDRPSPEVWLKDLTSEADKTPRWLSNLLPKQQESSQSSSSTGQQGTQTQQQTQQGQASQSSTGGGGQQTQAVNPNRTAVSTTGAHGAWVPTPEDRARAHAMAVKGDYSLAQRVQQADGFAPMQLPSFGSPGGQGGPGGQNTNGVG